MVAYGPSCAVVLALAIAACGGKPSGVIVDPPRLRIAMDGTWAIRSLSRIGSGDLPGAPATPAEPFQPVHLGMELELREELLRARDGAALFETFDPMVANTRWTNHADGWSLYFDFANSAGGSCVRYDEITAYFVPRDEDHMVGNVTIVSSGDSAAPPRLPPEATGQFSVVLERVASPSTQR